MARIQHPDDEVTNRIQDELLKQIAALQQQIAALTARVAALEAKP